jgi:Domain of unknown function (DUF4350)
MRVRWLELGILIASALVLIVFAAVTKVMEASAPNSIYSTYDTGPNGYGALYNVLRSAGVEANRFSRVLGLLDPGTGTLVLSSYANDPSPKPLDEQDEAALKRFVENGGRLVVLDDDFEGKDDITPGVGTSKHVKLTSATALARDRYTAGVDRVAAPIEAVFPFNDATRVPLLANDAGVVAVSYRLGKGEVVAITSPQLFSNAHLRDADNVRFAYNAIAGHGAVAFDEYVHGDDEDMSMWAALPRPVQIAVYVVALIVVLALIGANVPFAPPIPLDPPDERDSSAYLRAMGALMRRARAARAAVMVFAADAARRRRPNASAEQREAIAEIERINQEPHPSEAALVRAAVLDFRLRKELS